MNSGQTRETMANWTSLVFCILLTTTTLAQDIASNYGAKRDPFLPMQSGVELIDAEDKIFKSISKPDKLDNNINSLFSENGPIITPDGKTLFFSRSHHPDNVGGMDDDEDIWYSDWDEANNSWDDPKPMGYKLNNRGPNFINSVSIENGTQYLILGNVYDGPVKHSKMHSGLSFSKKTKKGWSYPESFEIEGFYNYDESADFTVSPDGKYLITSVDRDDSKGMRDLYVSFRVAENKWSVPFNLKSINTEFEESAPFLLDGEYLFFATDGRDGYGRSDIYVTRRLDSSWENWTEPINLGSRINDERDNEYFYYSKIKNKAFVTMGLHGNDTDIYELEIDLTEIQSTFEEVDACSSRTNFGLIEEMPSEKLQSNNCMAFDASEAGNDYEEPMKYMWYFGDYQIDYGMNVTHCYDQPGQYKVSMTAINKETYENHHQQIEKTVDILPEINLVLDVENEGRLEENLSYSAQLSFENSEFTDISYSWDFGDGEFGCGQYSNHEYRLPGEYKVRALVAFDIDGEMHRLMKEFVIVII